MGAPVHSFPESGNISLRNIIHAKYIDLNTPRTTIDAITSNAYHIQQNTVNVLPNLNLYIYMYTPTESIFYGHIHVYIYKS